MLGFYTYLISVWAVSDQLSPLTKEVGSFRHGEVIAGWDLQWSHHSDIGAHPLIHSGGFSVFRRSRVGQGRNVSARFCWLASLKTEHKYHFETQIKSQIYFVKLDWTIYTPGGPPLTTIWKEEGKGQLRRIKSWTVSSHFQSFIWPQRDEKCEKIFVDTLDDLIKHVTMKAIFILFWWGNPIKVNRHALFWLSRSKNCHVRLLLITSMDFLEIKPG